MSAPQFSFTVKSAADIDAHLAAVAKMDNDHEYREAAEEARKLVMTRTVVAGSIREAIDKVEQQFPGQTVVSAQVTVPLVV